MTNKRVDEIEREKESALVALFAISQTKDPKNVIRESIESVLDTYTRRIRTQFQKDIVGDILAFIPDQPARMDCRKLRALITRSLTKE